MLLGVTVTSRGDAASRRHSASTYASVSWLGVLSGDERVVCLDGGAVAAVRFTNGTRLSVEWQYRTEWLAGAEGGDAAGAVASGSEARPSVLGETRRLRVTVPPLEHRSVFIHLAVRTEEALASRGVFTLLVVAAVWPSGVPVDVATQSTRWTTSAGGCRSRRRPGMSPN